MFSLLDTLPWSCQISCPLAHRPVSESEAPGKPHQVCLSLLAGSVISGIFTLTATKVIRVYFYQWGTTHRHRRAHEEKITTTGRHRTCVDHSGIIFHSLNGNLAGATGWLPQTVWSYCHPIKIHCLFQQPLQRTVQFWVYIHTWNHANTHPIFCSNQLRHTNRSYIIFHKVVTNSEWDGASLSARKAALGGSEWVQKCCL